MSPPTTPASNNKLIYSYHINPLGGATFINLFHGLKMRKVARLLLLPPQWPHQQQIWGMGGWGRLLAKGGGGVDGRHHTFEVL